MRIKLLATICTVMLAVTAFGQSVERVVFQQQGTYPFSEDIF